MPTLLVQMQMLACCLRSSLTTSELLFLLSSQGGYTVAYCQKKISWRRAHTQLVLYFEGVAVPTADPQLLTMWAPVNHLGWNTKGLSRLPPLVFLGLRLAVKTPEEDRFRILHCLSCDQVGRRFITMNTHKSRNCFSRRTDFPRVLIWVLWENVRGNIAAVFWRQQSLGMEAPVCADWKMQTPSHQSSGCWRENLSQEGSNRISCATNSGELVQTLPKVARKRPFLPSGVDPQQTFFFYKF